MFVQVHIYNSQKLNPTDVGHLMHSLTLINEYLERIVYKKLLGDS